MTNEEAGEQLENLRAHCSNMLRHTFTDGEDIWGKDLEALDLAIKALEQEPKWIPVLERSPEKSGKYLAYIINKNDDKLQYIMTCEYLVDGYWHWFPDDECASDNVIAWMPLPEPYKPQAESEDKG